MKLPGNRDAVVQDGKLADYLLSETHPVGKAKAKYFRSLGYSIANAGHLMVGGKKSHLLFGAHLLNW